MLVTEAEIDKDALVGGCARLPLTVNSSRIHAEISRLPREMWNTAGRVNVHRFASAIYLRGYAPAEGGKPIEDREVFASLPYCGEIIGKFFDAVPQRCLFASLPAGKLVSEHTDNGVYFRKTMRIHIPIVTNDEVLMKCAGAFYRMLPNEVWALNNCAQHAVWNRHPTDARIHLICDFLMNDKLRAALLHSERALGVTMPMVERELNAASIALRTQ